MKRLAFTLMLLCAPLVLAQTVYKWTDEDGVVHYSDQPHPSAEKVHVKAVQTYKAQSGAPASQPAGGGSQQGAAPYQGCAITNPGDGSDWANLDSLMIVVQTDPGLRATDKVYVLYDGASMNGGNPTGPQFSISPVERGEHTVQGIIRDAQGQVQCQTPPIRFNVHQASIQNPANPARPPTPAPH